MPADVGQHVYRLANEPGGTLKRTLTTLTLTLDQPGAAPGSATEALRLEEQGSGALTT